MKTISLLCLFLVILDKQGGNATDTDQAELAAATPAKTTRATTATPLESPKTTKRAPGGAHCMGWCLKGQKISKAARTLNANVEKDKALMRKFAEVRSAVEKYPHFSLKLRANVFADKDQYADRESNRARSQLFEKNVVRIPSTWFYPYTRRALERTIEDSGNIYVPQRSMLSLASRSLPVRYQLASFIKNNPTQFHNSYFVKNPLLNIVSALHPSRRHKAAKRMGTTGYDRVDSPDEDAERGNALQFRVAKINDFIVSNSKKRSQYQKKPTELQQVLKESTYDTIMGRPQNFVDDIVGGMQIHAKDADTFLIGKTASARSKINQWVEPKSRSKNMPNSPGTGLIVSGKTRNKAIDVFLKSMVNEYQYGNQQLSYKKF